MDLASSRAGAIISLAVFITVPAAITALQIVHSVVNTLLKQYPILIITFSTLYYLFMVLIPAWASFYTDRLGSHWFMMLVLLYLLWSTLLYTLGQVLWSYLVLILTLIFIIFMIRPLYRYAHPGFFALYLVATFWVLYLFVMETIALFRGQY
jgi:hypothetical protein